MDGNELSLYQKASAHERIKHQPVMTGLIIHKASQVTGDDVKEAIGLLNQVNFLNRLSRATQRHSRSFGYTRTYRSRPRSGCLGKNSRCCRRIAWCV